MATKETPIERFVRLCGELIQHKKDLITEQIHLDRLRISVDNIEIHIAKI